MPASLSIDIGGFLDGLDELPDLINGAIEEALDRCAEVALNEKLREVQKTYSRPIPTNAQVAAADRQIVAGKKVRVKGGRKSIGLGGKPAWTRSGDWAAQQSILRPSDMVREIGPVGSSEDYEERLADLPTGALGENRSNDAGPKARATTEPQLPALLEQELQNALDP